ncbi:hypothetical protein Tco_0991016 [Tanacetum coccineum]|uniref:Aminotransferase-like plant mobile domain-containing protein n=1 Tax=Tanacetum coccineum TaxID=301880 RepID=A0ABQ5EZR9_9ASTR
MDNPNLTMEEYIRLKEEKACKHEKVFNWQTATYGKIRVDVDLYDLKSMEAEFPAIVVNDDFAPQDILQCKSQRIDILIPIRHMALPPRKQRHIFLRYEGLEYTDSDIAGFELRLERIYTREIHKRQFILALGLHTGEETESPGFARYWSESERIIPGKGDLHDYWRDILTDGDILGPPPSYTLIRDPIPRLCHWMMAHSIVGRSQTPEKVIVIDLFYLRGLDVGSFVGRLAQHFGLLTAEILRGLTVVAPELQMIYTKELVRLWICVQLDDTWDWVAMGLERQPNAAVGAPAVAEDIPIIDEGGQANSIPEQAPQQPPPPPSAAARTMPQRIEEDVHGLRRDVESLRRFMERSMTDQGRFSMWMMSCMTQLMNASGLTYQAFDETFQGSSPAAFQRRTRQRTDGPSTSTAQQDQQYQDRNTPVFPIFYTGPHERIIDEYWWRIYESGNLEVLES